MKKIVTWKSETGESYELLFTISRLQQLEETIGKAIYAFIAEVGLGNLYGLNLAFTIAGLRIALGETEQKAIEIIEAHCDAGGTVDDINGKILNAVFATGLFTKGTESPTPEQTA